MALTGTFVRNLDQKHRLAIPKRLREDFGESRLTHLFVAPGTDRSLSVYGSSAFEALAAQLTAHTGPVADSRNYLRMFYARAERVEIDGQGRIRIPERLVELAGLQRSAVLLGVHDHVEIWDEGHWNSFIQEHAPKFDELANRAFQSESAG